VVNAPDLSGVTALEELRNGLTFLSDNAPGNFVMTGYVNSVLHDNDIIPVTVRRIVARVSIGGVRTDFRFIRSDYEMTLDAVYLVNVPDDNNYEGLDKTPMNWVNRLGHYDAGYDALLYDEVGGSLLKNGSPYEGEHVFYTYPSPAAPAGNYSEYWSPRRTLLVLEMTFNGEKAYYPLELPAIERNRTYEIEEVVITREPSAEPYVPILVGDTGVEVTVKTWELGLNLGTIEI
jgi:hypothetical protein